MTNRKATKIGRVRHVLGSTITIELDDDLAGVAPIWKGELKPIGQIGSLVRIPQGPTTLIGAVILVGISELVEAPDPSRTSQLGNRWLKVQLIGEINALKEFERGVSSYPGLDDPVHFASSDELSALYPAPDGNHVEIGRLSAAPDVVFSLSADKLVTRHSAVVGSTGSGKTSAVATIVQRLVRDGWGAANILIVDPHGEYATAMSADAVVTRLADAGTPLRVPYWALPANDVLYAIARVTQAGLQQQFGEAVVKAKRAYVDATTWTKLDKAEINPDSPVPYDIRSVWYDLDRANRVTLSDKVNNKEALTKEGQAETLQSATFQASTTTNTAPFQGPNYNKLTPVPERLKLALQDPRLKFFLDSFVVTDADPLPSIIEQWIAKDKPTSVLDFSGVPSMVTDLAVGGILSLLFDIASRCVDTGIGFPYPMLVILEEAHRYLVPGDTVRMAREAANRIAREGRKYGVGMMLVSQRPSELPDTALSQVGTIVAMRLTNTTDQNTVKSALPDAVAGLAEALPSLRNGEALVSGEAASLPSRVRVNLPDPRPDADDPSLDAWRKIPKKLDVAAAVDAWRGTEKA